MVVKSHDYNILTLGITTKSSQSVQTSTGFPHICQRILTQYQAEGSPLGYIVLFPRGAEVASCMAGHGVETWMKDQLVTSHGILVPVKKLSNLSAARTWRSPAVSVTNTTYTLTIQVHI